MRSYWQSTRLGWTIIATMFAVAIVECGFSDLVLWINGVVLNMKYLLLPALLLMGAALGTLVLRAVQKNRGSALPG